MAVKCLCKGLGVFFHQLINNVSLLIVSVNFDGKQTVENLFSIFVKQ